MSDPTTYRCPTCRSRLQNGLDTPTFPFCSKRCKLVDLGRWFDGEYRVSEPLSPWEMESLESESEMD